MKIKLSKIPFLNGSKHIKHFSLLDCLVKYLNDEFHDSAPRKIEIATQNLAEHCDLNTSENSSTEHFLLEQLQLLTKSTSQKRYSNSLLSLSLLLYTYNSSVYRRIREMNFIILPTERTLQNISGAVNKKSNLSYLKLRNSKLSSFEQNVILLFDEIYIKRKLEYFNGSLYGEIDDGDIAQTVLCFMISSLCGQYRDIVKMVPLRRINCEVCMKLDFQLLQYALIIMLLIDAFFK